MNSENLEKIITLRHFLHQHPELSLLERQTMEYLKEFLRANTSLQIVSRDGWFYAVKKGSSEGAIAFRADMDALPMEEGIVLSYGSQNPGAAHKCGHDGHCAALCGLALELDLMELEPTVYLIFQPAEEIGAGAKGCASLISEAGISQIYAFHNLGGFPGGAVVYRRGLTQPASEGLQLQFRGKTSHASAPEAGANPAEILAQLVLFAKEKSKDLAASGSMVLCTVVGMELGHGDFGISPGEGSLKLTLRAEEESHMKELERSICDLADSLSRSQGIKVEVSVHDYFPETRNEDQCLDRVLKTAKMQGLEIVEMPFLWRASEDFGYYTKQCPGAMIYIGNGEAYPALHTREYDFPDGILRTAVELFAALAQSAADLQE